MKNYLTSSERRGVIIVASIALLITGIGAAFSLVGGNVEDLSGSEIEIIADGDTIPALNQINKKSGKNKGQKKKSKTKRKTTYSERSPLDEPV